MKPRHVIGCMSGTSMDAIDAALVRIAGHGLELKARFVRGCSRTMGGLAGSLKRMVQRYALPASETSRLAREIAEAHLETIHELIQGGDELVHLIGVHGQTVFHKPPNSLQLINPHPIAQKFDLPVAFDFRGADIAAGGQGAPITPLADYVLFRNASEARAVVNLGGFANYTWLPAGDGVHQVRGGDICSCNQLLDSVARQWLKVEFDEDGAQAERGTVDPDAEPFLAMMLHDQVRSGRSLGSDDDSIVWPLQLRESCSGVNLAATACALIGRTIAHSVPESARIILGGGGANNRTLVDVIRANVDAPVNLTKEDGIPIQYREAVCMAVLTALARDGVSITLPQVTGRDPKARCFPCWIEP